MNQNPQFEPIYHSWVAIHPNPKGIIQFVGGAFFGTFFPQFWYRHLLSKLFAESYTLILYPFDFSFDHYRESFFLLKEQARIIPDLVARASSKKNRDIYLKPSSYYWLGHSIGCKYIALLEGFNVLAEQKDKERKSFIRTILKSDNSLYRSYSEKKFEKLLQTVLDQINFLIQDLRRESIQSEKRIKQYFKSDDYKFSRSFYKFDDSKSEEECTPSILDQPSLLIAPDNSDISAAIKPKPIAKLIERFGIRVKPSPVQTKALMQEGDFFNLMGLICFSSDNIARETCKWFIHDFKKPPAESPKYLPLEGGHLRPLGIQVGNKIFNPWPQSITKRDESFEDPVIKLLKLLGTSKN